MGKHIKHLLNLNKFILSGPLAHPLYTHGTWAMPMGWGHPQRIHGAWALPMGWALLSAHVALKRRWVGDKWRLGSPRPNYP